MPKTYALYMPTYAHHHSVHICENQDQIYMHPRPNRHDVTYALDISHICNMCPKTISLKPHHYGDHNRTIILLPMKNTTESQ